MSKQVTGQIEFNRPLPTWESLAPYIKTHWQDLTNSVLIPAVSFEGTADTPDYSPKELADKISTDLVLCGRILSVVNSAAIGLVKPMTSVERAIAHLGANMVQSIIIACYLEGVLGRWPKYPKDHFHYIQLWSTAASIIGYNLGKRVNAPDPALVGTAALLARLGSLVLGLEWPGPGAEYRVLPDEVLRLNFEVGRWTVSSSMLSRLLARNWGLPEPIPRLLGRHTDPFFNELTDSEEDQLVLLIAVSTALAAIYLAGESSGPETLNGMQNYRILNLNITKHELLQPILDTWNSQRTQIELDAAKNI